MDRPSLLGARLPPLRIVHVASERSEIDVPGSLEIAVRRDRAQKIALYPLGLF
jgi:hypothetical protein